MKAQIGSRIDEIDFGRMIRKGKVSHYEYFREGRSYAIPAGLRHQIIISGSGRDKGLGFSDKEEEGFRCFNQKVIYWFNGKNTYILGGPKGDTIDLSWIRKKE